MCGRSVQSLLAHRTFLLSSNDCSALAVLFSWLQYGGPFLSSLGGQSQEAQWSVWEGSVYLAEYKRKRTILWSIYFHFIHSQGCTVFASLIFWVHWLEGCCWWEASSFLLRPSVLQLWQLCFQIEPLQTHLSGLPSYYDTCLFSRRILHYMILSLWVLKCEGILWIILVELLH